MSTAQRIRGVLSPVVTPFDADLRPARGRFVRHCRWLLSQDVGLAVFGTNSEANSLTVAEKIALLDTLVEAGLPRGADDARHRDCALPDTVELTRHAIEARLRRRADAAAVLLQGRQRRRACSAASREVIERVGDDRLRIYLYHIPPVVAGADHADADRAAAEGVSRASSPASRTAPATGRTRNAMLEQFQPHGFDVFAGSETFLLATLRGGGAGCITATGNVNPGADRHARRHLAAGRRRRPAGRRWTRSAPSSRAT